MIEVIDPGLATSVQDFPGRIGISHLGYPPSGPMDPWSFRLANLLVGNPPDAAGLECQFIGPTLRIHRSMTVAVCGGDMEPSLDGSPLAAWTATQVRPGQVITMGHTRVGARAYLAFSGGIDVPLVLGSRSTFRDCELGGLEGDVLKKGQTLDVFESDLAPARSVRRDRRPSISSTRVWEVEAVAGPNDDWISPKSLAQFFSADWTVTAKSARTGYRLSGPDFSYSKKALDKNPDNGSGPTDILDHGYPIGGVNLSADAPIILLADGYSFGGLINPFTIPSAGLWKVGQACPGDKFRFRQVSVETAAALAREIDNSCTVDALIET